ncbi:MAG: hypothetical protein K5705_15860 [Oscillospiraceae bacterium]|nr:hypothetical protein [Oscillospiraceae bacterium]MCR4761721.1 hypothetical protein [Oscillospiraceae bacterium]
MTSYKQTKNRSVYVVVTRTGTGVARAIRVLSRKQYSHVSLSADASLHQLYSFCRNYTRIPLPATFNTEQIGEGTLGKFSVIPCEIYEIPLTDQQYRHFLRMIAHFRECRKLYSYSVMGLMRVWFQIESELQNKFVCSQFVAYVLEECGVTLDKPPCLYSPDDLRYLPDAKLIYRGELNQYYHERNDGELNYLPLIHSAV